MSIALSLPLSLNIRPCPCRKTAQTLLACYQRSKDMISLFLYLMRGMPPEAPQASRSFECPFFITCSRGGGEEKFRIGVSGGFSESHVQQGGG